MADDRDAAMHECARLFRRFYQKYRDLDVVPGCLDEWLKGQFDGSTCEDMENLFGFDLPQSLPVEVGPAQHFTYTQYRLPQFTCCFLPSNRMLTPKEVQQIPNLSLPVGLQWEHYMTTLDETPRVLHLRARCMEPESAVPAEVHPPAVESVELPPLDDERGQTRPNLQGAPQPVTPPELRCETRRHSGPPAAAASASSRAPTVAADPGLHIRLAELGYNPKFLPENTPDLWELAEAMELTYNATKGMPLDIRANVMSNALVWQRLTRGARAQKWLQKFLVTTCMEELKVSGGQTPEHCEAMQSTAVKVLDAHDKLVKSGAEPAAFASHGEKRHKLFSGRYSIHGGTTDRGAQGIAECAGLLQPLFRDILAAEQLEKCPIYHFTDDDIVLCVMSFFGKVILRVDDVRLKPQKQAEDAGGQTPGTVIDLDADEEDAGGQTPGTVTEQGKKYFRCSWYNSVNAGWSVLSWALLGKHATIGELGRGSFLLAMMGQSEKSATELATMGIRTSADFNAEFDKLRRISAHSH